MNCDHKACIYALCRCIRDVGVWGIWLEILCLCVLMFWLWCAHRAFVHVLYCLCTERARGKHVLHDASSLCHWLCHDVIVICLCSSVLVSMMCCNVRSPTHWTLVLCCTSCMCVSQDSHESWNTFSCYSEQRSSLTMAHNHTISILISYTFTDGAFDLSMM